MLDISVTRTANAGVLLELDGKRILLDGFCEPLPPYLGTPHELREALIKETPDVVAFTHEHPDHYDPNYTKLYKEKTLRSVYGPESLPFYELGNGICMSLVETRHIGKTDIPHVSYVVSGSKTVWFMGDATPLSLKKMTELKKPDLLIVPFAYAITPSAWRMTKEIGVCKILLIHMPKKEEDKDNIWNIVRDTVGDDDSLIILGMGEKACL